MRPVLDEVRELEGIVVPLISSGLHCGDWEQSEGGGGQYVVPLVSSGLHCGGMYEDRVIAERLSSR